jgi:hypothetical protein
MTKEEVIQKAYGEYWDLFDKSEQLKMLNNNGWNSYFNHPLHWEMNKFIEIETMAYGIGTSWRPKSLAGIENNNGWFQCDKNNPSIPFGHYHVIREYSNDINIEFFDGIFSNYSCYKVTHYQPIQKPNPPIY